MLVYGSNETHIIMYNLKMQNWNQLEFWKYGFLFNISSDSIIHALKRSLTLTPNPKPNPNPNKNGRAF